MSQWRIEVRDGTLTQRGPVAVYSKFTAILRFNDAGSWLLEGVPTDSVAGEVLSFGSGGGQSVGIVLLRDDVPIMSGPLTEPTRTDSDKGRTMQAVGSDDTALLADRFVWPDAYPFDDAGHDEFSGNAESALRYYVSRNLGPDAGSAFSAPERNLTGLVMGLYGGYGSQVVKAGRFENLLDWSQQIATAGGGLRFQIVQTSTFNQREFRVTMPQDKRATVVWSKDFRNLSQTVVKETAATSNAVIVGGSGELNLRTFARREDPDSIGRYGRKETFVSYSNTTDATALGNTLANTLEGGRGGTTLSLTPTDSETLAFLEHYDLGDQVTVLVDGISLDAFVSQVTITIDSQGGVTVVPVVQTVTAVSVSPAGRVQGLASRLGRMEANVEGFTIGMGMLWWRPISEIPVSWALMDGSDPSIPDTAGRFLIGAGGTYLTGGSGLAVGATSGRLDANGDWTINTGHHHGMNHTHPHHHAGAGHTHAYLRGLPHTHQHHHTGAPHTHLHHHSGDPHTHAHRHDGHAHHHTHAHTMNAHHHTHAHTGIAHSHGHTHTFASGALNHSHTTTHAHSHSHQFDHSHQTDIAHNHGGGVTGNSNQSQLITTGGAGTDAPVAHNHNITALPSGSLFPSGSPNTTTTGGGSDSPLAAGSDNGTLTTPVTTSDSTSTTSSVNNDSTDTTSTMLADSTGMTQDSQTGFDINGATSPVPNSAGNTGDDTNGTTSPVPASAGNTGDDTDGTTSPVGSSSTNVPANTNGADYSGPTGADTDDVNSPVPSSSGITADAGTSTQSIRPPYVAVAVIYRLV